MELEFGSLVKQLLFNCCRELLWKQDNPVAQKIEHGPRSNKVLGLNARTDIPSTT